MKIYVDGGCRRNGYSDAVAAAAAVRMDRFGRYWHRQRRLSGRNIATNQRAEITAIILGLEMALEKYQDLNGCPRLKVTIHSDSQYAVKCLDQWVYKWANNGWINCQGREVANRDLIEKASNLDDRIRELGNVQYVWIPRCENSLADKHCNEEMDAMERQVSNYFDDSDGYSYGVDCSDDSDDSDYY